MSEEIKNFDEIVSFLNECDNCRLAFMDGEYPYVLPFNYGLQARRGKIILYVKGASGSKKFGLIEENKHVGFEMDSIVKTRTGEKESDFTIEYKSVSGYGIIKELEDYDKIDALEIVRNHYIYGDNVAFESISLEKTKAYKIVVKGISWRNVVKKNVLVR